MAQAISSPNAKYRRVPFHVIKDACNGNIEAMTLIERNFEPYMRRVATISVCGKRYQDVELYDRLKTRLLTVTLKFQL